MMGRKSLEPRDQVMMLCLEELVPQNHMVRKMEKVLDLSFVYDLLEDTYCEDNGRPSVDPVVILKLALIKKMFGIRSIRKTVEEASLNNAYRWYLGYGLNEEVPHFTSFLKSYAKRFGDNDLFGELFGRVLSKCVEKKVLKADVVFMDSTHMKASANKNKATSKEIEEQGKHYQDELEAEINEARMELGKAPLKKKKK